MARLCSSCTRWLKFSSLTSAKFLIGSAWDLQMLWTPTHAAMHLHALSGEKNKAPPTKLHSLCWIWLNQAATVWSRQRKADMVMIWNFPGLYFLFTLLQMQVIPWLISQQCWKIAYRTLLQLKLLSVWTFFCSPCANPSKSLSFSNSSMQDSAKHKS